MPLLHEQAVRSGIEGQLRALTPDRRPSWGRMSVDLVDEVHQILSGIGASCQREALGVVRPRGSEIALRQCQPTHAGEHPNGFCRFDDGRR